jgi:hypothetical protein
MRRASVECTAPAFLDGFYSYIIISSPEGKEPLTTHFPAQAHADPPRLRLFTEQMWKQFQRKLQSLGLSPKPKRSEGEGDKPKRPARTPSALSWELVWRRRG